MRQQETLRQRVMDALRTIPDMSNVGVSVAREMVVTLAGSVPSRRSREVAEVLAAQIAGVSSVSNGLWVDDLAGRAVEEVIVPVDLTERNVVSFRYARLFAKKLGSRLTIVHADPLDPVTPRQPEHVERLLRTLELYAGPHLDPHPFETVIERNNDPASAIMRRVKRSANPLIVMETAARHPDGAKRESITLDLVRRSGCPVLVRGEEDDTSLERGIGITTIVCAVDATEAARTNVEYAAKLADAFDARLVIVHIARPQSRTGLDYERERLRMWADRHLPRPHRQIVIRSEDVHASLIEQARLSRADLIVAGARPRMAGWDVVTGTTTERLVTAAPLPVLTVPLPPG